MIETGLARYIHSMRKQQVISYASSLMLFRFMRTGRKTIVDIDQAFQLAQELTARLNQAQLIPKEKAWRINPPLSSIIAVTARPGGFVIRTSLVVDREPEAKIAYTRQNELGVQIVNLQTRLLWEAALSRNSYLFTPENIPEIAETLYH